MRKRILLSLLALAALVMLVGCGKSTTPEESAKPKEEVKPITIRMLTEYSLKDPRGQMVQGFVDRVVKETNGQVKIELYPDGQLYKSTEHFEAVSAGNVEMAITHFGKGWPQIIPQLTLLGSGVFNDSTHALKALNGPLGERLAKLLEEKADAKLLAWTGAGNVDAMGASKKQIKQPADLKGLKMRIPTPAQAAFVEALGGAATIITPSEMYLALQNGTVDGIFSTTPSGVVNSKLFEPAKYWTRIRLAVGVEHGFVVNMDAWNKLPADVQKVMQTAAQDVGKTLISELEKNAEKEWDAVKNSPGVQVYTVPEAELAQWKAILAPASTKILEKVLPKEEVTELLDMVNKAK